MLIETLSGDNVTIVFYQMVLIFFFNYCVWSYVVLCDLVWSVSKVVVLSGVCLGLCILFGVVQLCLLCDRIY